MIKLIDILKEMAISNAWSGDIAKLEEETDEVIKAAKKMGESNPVLWRGTHGVKIPGHNKSIVTRIMYITGDRTAFRGGHPNAIKVLKLRGIENPVFAHFDRSATPMFGEPCVVVPDGDYKMYQSSKLEDIMADTGNYRRTKEYKIDKKGNRLLSGSSSKFKEKTPEELEADAASYEELKDLKPKYRNEPANVNEPGVPREVILDVKNYWAVKAGPEIKTYSDLVKLLESYKKEFIPQKKETK